MSKHTPGPWTVKLNRVERHPVYGPDGEPVARCLCPRPSTKEWDANARLIAAAPEMLEALELFMEAYPEHECFSTGPNTGNPWTDYVYCPGCEAEVKARGAIAKAKGE